MKLSPELNIAVQVAINEAASRGHEYAGLEHLLYALLHHDAETGDVVRHCGGDVQKLKEKLARFLDQSVEKVPNGLHVQPDLTAGFKRVLTRAAAHVDSSGKDLVGGKNVLVALFAERDSFALHFLQEQGIERLDVVGYISHGISKLDPDEGALPAPTGDGGDDEAEAGGSSKRDPLEAFCVNLNQLAIDGKIDPLIGREKEIERTLHVLCRRRKNNPLFVGDAGVGKTALIEGLALKIVKKQVPPALADSVIYGLDMGSVLAGTRYRGDFEQRIKAVLKALEKQPKSILAIDEIHTLIGAGSASGGAMDASNLLKPALASGTLRCVGMTTYHDFRTYFERDRALVRRFQKIEVSEPSVEDSIAIVEGLRPSYEEFHDVKYGRAAIRAAVVLSDRYIHDRKLPDKAIDVLDEAGSAAKLKGRKGGRVGANEIESIIATMAQIPPKRVSRSDKDRLKNLEDELKSVVFGQDHAIDLLASSIRMSRAGLRSPEKPIGSFLLTGPTGVGKTEVAKQLAAILGVEFLRFDMSEYMERHTVSRLIGAPPGYVGFDQGGLLTEAVNKTPHAVLLLDEIEKAHPDVFNILLQVMDHGTLTDNNGRKADFRHVILLMTSNVGAREMARGSLGFGERGLGHAEDKAYQDLFSPEFRNRLDARIPFASLSPDTMGRIVQKFVNELVRQLAERKVTIELSDEARDYFAKKGFDAIFGARPLARVIQEELKRPLSEEILFGKLEKGGDVLVDFRDEKLVFDFGEPDEVVTTSDDETPAPASSEPPSTLVH